MRTLPLLATLLLLSTPALARTQTLDDWMLELQLAQGHDGMSAAAAMGELGPAAERAVPLLVAKLGDEAYRLVGTVKHALHQIGAGAVPGLIDGLKHPNRTVRSHSAEVLGDLGPAARPATAALAWALAEDHNALAARALADVATPDASVPVLIEALADPEGTVREEATGALRRLGPAAVSGSTALGELLNHADGSVRTSAVTVLGSLGTRAKSFVPRLIALAADPEQGWDVRIAAVSALGTTGGDPEFVVPALIQAMEQRPLLWVSLDAIQGYGEAAASAVPLLEKNLLGDEYSIRSLAATALSNVGAAGLPSLRRAMKSPSKEVRRETVIALMKMGATARPAVADLEKALADDDSDVRIVAQLALEKIR